MVVAEEEDIPSVYIVDPAGNGTGATASAAIVNW